MIFIDCRHRGDQLHQFHGWSGWLGGWMLGSGNHSGGGPTVCSLAHLGPGGLIAGFLILELEPRQGVHG